ncbi:ATP-binding protein [Streptomyces formicae]|uniref:ATP-binding protein n=1 Tax=Streptomyces formicae TaxID=1616117 RepID=A0ABY3WQS0_9ACTN|nr:ATP-binding protein [Streptomyces formicae]UNM13137.1 ATP-binding protein [Streptomyces formicae]
MTVATAVAPVTARSLPRPAYAAFEVCFAPDSVWVGRSRRITNAFLRWRKVTGPLAENVVLCVSELVTNGVTHGEGDVSLRIRCCGKDIRVEVVDSNPAPATMRSADDDDPSGRGLLLVTVLSRKWGVSKDGTTTWCTFRIPEGRS